MTTSGSVSRSQLWKLRSSSASVLQAMTWVGNAPPGGATTPASQLPRLHSQWLTGSPRRYSTTPTWMTGSPSTAGRAALSAASTAPMAASRAAASCAAEEVAASAKALARGSYRSRARRAFSTPATVALPCARAAGAPGLRKTRDRTTGGTKVPPTPPPFR